MRDKQSHVFSGAKRGRDYILAFQREKSIAQKNEDVAVKPRYLETLEYMWNQVGCISCFAGNTEPTNST